MPLQLLYGLTKRLVRNTVHERHSLAATVARIQSLSTSRQRCSQDVVGFLHPSQSSRVHGYSLIITTNQSTMPALRGILVSLITCALAADQSPPTAFALTQQYRPDTKWRSCKSTGNVRTNCGFCYSRSGSFQGWNCNCDKFVCR